MQERGAMIATSIARRSCVRYVNSMLRWHCRSKHTKCRANHAPLSPISFLERAALCKPRSIAIKYGETVVMTYAELMVSVQLFMILSAIFCWLLMFLCDRELLFGLCLLHLQQYQSVQAVVLTFKEKSERI